ncbi:major facilitator superfamily domain-containing protein [Suillus spraguei]|nr:major facilitator superfamily domain-containing protein [Suillus spraguei]
MLLSPPRPESSHTRVHLPDQIHNSIDHHVHVPAAIIPDHNLERKIQDKQLEDQWQHDPINPRNWYPARKWTTTAIMALYSFVTPLASSIMAPGLPDLAIKYGITDPTVTALTLSIFILSFAIGPLFAAPLSEVYGRPPLGKSLLPRVQSRLRFVTKHFIFPRLSVSGHVIDPLLTRLPLLFIAGFVGSAPVACGGGVVSDIFSESDRASAMAVYFVGPLIGPVSAPSWEASSQILGFLLMRESYAPVIWLRREQRYPDLERAVTIHPAFTMNKWAYLWMSIKRPIMIMTHSFKCSMLSLYMALIFGIYYMMFTTFPDLFSNVYHFSVGIGGLSYIGLGVGLLSPLYLAREFATRYTYMYLAAKNGGKGKPEMRVPALIFGSLIIPVGLFWYGWSAQARVHFMMPIIGTAILGFGIMTSSLAIQLYLVDTFTYAASAVAAASMLRFLFGFASPPFGQQMFAALGYGWGNSLLAGLAIVIGIPFPIWIYYAGERMRARSSSTR